MDSTSLIRYLSCLLVITSYSHVTFASHKRDDLDQHGYNLARIRSLFPHPKPSRYTYSSWLNNKYTENIFVTATSLGAGAGGIILSQLCTKRFPWLTKNIALKTVIYTVPQLGLFLLNRNIVTRKIAWNCITPRGNLKHTDNRWITYMPHPLQALGAYGSYGVTTGDWKNPAATIPFAGTLILSFLRARRLDKYTSDGFTEFLRTHHSDLNCPRSAIQSADIPEAHTTVIPEQDDSDSDTEH
jgi:hypothetical protein